MTTPRMHHYIPETYQCGFLTSDQKNIAFYDMQTGKSDKTSPSNLAKERDLYKMEAPPQGESATFIENPILSHVDGTYSRLLDELVRKNISSEVRKELSVFLGWLRSRTPGYFKAIESMSKRFVAGEFYKDMLSDPLKLQKALEAEFDISSVEAFTSQAEQALSIDRDPILKIFLGVAEATGEWIVQSGWEILIAGSGSFITSDQPFCPLEDQYVFVGQGKSKNQRYFMVPLSSKLALKITGAPQGVKFTTLSKDQVLEINGAVAYCADRWLLGESEESLKAAHQRAVELQEAEKKAAEVAAVLGLITGHPQV